MLRYALKMLFGDPVKYGGLVFGIAFATLLITQQASIFTWLISRAANPVLNVPEADIWVMDPRVRTVEQPIALRDQELSRVRSVEGIESAVPLSINPTSARTDTGRVVSFTLVGIDAESLAGAPKSIGDDADLLSALRYPAGMVLDQETARQFWPDSNPLDAIGRVVEINDNRVVISAIGDALPGFASANSGYMRYTDAKVILPPVRNTLSYVLVTEISGNDLNAVAAEIERSTALKARLKIDFVWDSIFELAASGGIVPGFATTIALGVIVGLAITGLTLSLFVQENIRQFGALKAIGVTNLQTLGMLSVQTVVVGITGFGLGIGSTAGFVRGVSNGGSFEGLILYGEIVWGCAALVSVILVLSALTSIRKVLTLDPAEVFR